jgi:hypothetical protein
MPAFNTLNRNGFNSRLRDQNITQQVFSRYGTESTSVTLTRSAIAEDSEYNLYVTAKQQSGSSLSNPLITKFNKRGQKVWEVGLENTFLSDIYRFGVRGQFVPADGEVSIDVNSLSYITFWYSAITLQNISPSGSLLNSTNGTVFWIVVNNDPTRIYNLMFDRNRTSFSNYYRQGIHSNQLDGQKFINDIRNRVIRPSDTFRLLYQASFSYEDIPIAIDKNDDILVGYRAFYDRNNSTILYSDNLNGSSWGNYCGTSASITPNTTAVTAPDGSFTATRVIRNNVTSCSASTAWGRFWNSFSTVQSGVNYTLSIYVRGAVGGEIVTFGIADGNTANYTLTTEWQKITYTANAVSNSRGLQIYSSQPNITFYMWGARIQISNLIDERLAFYLTKLNKKNGSVKWANEYYITADTFASNLFSISPSDIKSIITDDNNNIYICGSAYAAEGPHTLTGNNFGFIIKLSNNGKILWKRLMYSSQSPIPQASSIADNQITSLALSPDNSKLYASGGSYTVNGAGSCLYKINSSTGELEFAPKIYNLYQTLNQFMFIPEIVVDSEENIYGIIGNLGSPESLFDYSVIKFDSSGNILWANRYDTNDATESGINLVVDRFDVIHIAGRCDTVLNERPGVLSLNTNQTVNSFRRLRYRREPFIDELGISLKRPKCFITSNDRNRHTLLMLEDGLNGYVIGMIQKERFAVGTYETNLDRYIISGSNPFFTDITPIVVERNYSSIYSDDLFTNLFSETVIFSKTVSPIEEYRVFSSVIIPQ